MRSWIACFVVCAGCAVARERDVDGGPLRDAPPADVPHASVVDALRDADGPSVPPDVGPLGEDACPAREVGFSFVRAGSLAIEGADDWIQLSGDGEVVYALVDRAPSGLSVLRVDPTGRAAEEIFRSPQSFGSLTVDDGVARAVSRDDAWSPTLHVFEARGVEISEIGTMPPAPRGLATGAVRWNGTSLVSLVQTGDLYNIWVGPFGVGPEPASWFERWPVERQALDVDARGRAHVVFQTAHDWALHEVVIDAAGTVVSETALVSPRLMQWGYAIAWVDDDTGQPLVLAGYSEGPVAGAPLVQRFTPDGGLGSRVDFPSHARHVNITSRVPRGVATGYAAAATLDDAGTLAFQGLADGTSSEVIELPTACGEHVGIAAGACGWLVACRDPWSRVIETFLAVPPAGSP